MTLPCHREAHVQIGGRAARSAIIDYQILTRNDVTGSHVETKGHELEKRRLTRCDELMDLISQTLCQARQEIERNDNECPIRLVVVVWILLESLILGKTGVDDIDTPLIHWLGVRSKRTASGYRDR
jgi:hypothetical protein